MCKNCNCDNYDKCSIVGYMPIGFCCTYCYLYDVHHTCLTTATKSERESSQPSLEHLELISASIEDQLLHVVIEKEGKMIPLFIDLKKYLKP